MGGRCRVRRLPPLAEASRELNVHTSAVSRGHLCAPGEFFCTAFFNDAGALLRPLGCRLLESKIGMMALSGRAQVWFSPDGGAHWHCKTMSYAAGWDMPPPQSLQPGLWRPQARRKNESRCHEVSAPQLAWGWKTLWGSDRLRIDAELGQGLQLRRGATHAALIPTAACRKELTLDDTIYVHEP